MYHLPLVNNISNLISKHKNICFNTFTFESAYNYELFENGRIHKTLRKVCSVSKLSHFKYNMTSIVQII